MNYNTSKEVSKNCGSMCIRCISISMNKIAWRFMRACHEELTLCWRVGVIGPITKDYAGNLNTTEKLYILYSFSFGVATNFPTINVIMWNFTYMCTSLCSIISNLQIWKRTYEVFVVVCWRWVCSTCTWYWSWVQMTLKSRPSLIVLIREKFSAWSLCHGKKQMIGTQLKADY